jgi:hypothetical protein
MVNVSAGAHLQDVDDAHEVNLVHAPGRGDASVVRLEYRAHLCSRQVTLRSMNDRVCRRQEELCTAVTFVIGCAFYCCGGVSALPSGGGRSGVREHRGAVLLA